MNSCHPSSALRVLASLLLYKLQIAALLLILGFFHVCVDEEREKGMMQCNVFLLDIYRKCPTDGYYIFSNLSHHFSSVVFKSQPYLILHNIPNYLIYP